MRLIDGDALYERIERLYPNCNETVALAILAMVRNAPEVKPMTARLLTENEARSLTYRPYYLETRDGELELYCTLFGHFNGLVWLSVGGVEKPIGFDPATYGSEWRLWTWEPTDVQTEDEEWREC